MKLLYILQWILKLFGAKDEDVDFLHKHLVAEIVLDILVVVLLFTIFMLIFGTLDDSFAKKVIVSGKVIDKIHKPSVTVSGTGVGMNTYGSPVVKSTTIHDAEGWYFIVKEGDGLIRRVYCTMQEYYDNYDKETIQFEKKLGYFTDDLISCIFVKS